MGKGTRDEERERKEDKREKMRKGREKVEAKFVSWGGKERLNGGEGNGRKRRINISYKHVQIPYDEYDQYVQQISTNKK